MPYITESDVDAILTEGVRIALFTDAGVYNSGAFTLMVESATADVKSALKASGYPAPETVPVDGSTGSFLKTRTLGRFIKLAYGRAPHSIEIDDNMRELVRGWQELRNGDAQVPGLDPVQTGAHGGSKFVSSSARGPMTSRRALRSL